MKVTLLTRLWSWRVAEVTASLSEVTAMIRSLFISTSAGTVGVGRDEILMENTILARRVSPTMLKPILLLTTSALNVTSLEPCTISTTRGKSWKLLNY